MFEKILSFLLTWLALPTTGLSTLFIVAFLSATLLPLGSEPLLFAVIKANPDHFWWAIIIATGGNTLGGVINYWLGYLTHETFAKHRETRWFSWLKRYGAKTLLLTWLPIIGDPLSMVAGWLKLPFWACTAYMLVGKALRYIVMTTLLLAVPNSVWRPLIDWLH